jgi:salicylate hydroxylase
VVRGPRRARRRPPPAYRGYAAWRATLPREAAPAELSGSETGLWLGRGGHVVHYPIAGGRLVNIVAIERRRKPVEGWSAPGDRAELLSAFAEAAPPLRRLIEAAPEWRLWSLYDLPAKTMARGRIALLGDAAHPVLPFLAQGGALAIEDAAVLAARLAEAADPAAALSATPPRGSGARGASRRPPAATASPIMWAAPRPGSATPSCAARGRRAWWTATPGFTAGRRRPLDLPSPPR